MNAIELSRNLGYSIAGSIGATAFIELEHAYASRLIPKFLDDPIIRLNQNILLYWQFGFYKSTLLRVFQKTIPENNKAIDIASMTLEKSFGSISSKKNHIVKPAFTNDVKFVLISELALLLGQKDAMKQFSNVMNAVLESERVTRETIGLGYGFISEQEIRELESEGVTYDPKKGSLSYKPNVCVMAATRPLDNKYYTYLNNSGHLSRYHVIQCDINEKEASKHLHKNYVMDETLFEKLKNVNKKLSEIRISKVYRPDESLTKPIFDDLEILIKEELEKRRIEFSTIANPRLKGDVIREFVSHAFLRTASENDYSDIDVLEYTSEDVDFIRSRLHHFIYFQLNPIIAEDYTQVRKRRSKKALAQQKILEYLSDGEVRSRKQIVKFVQSTGRISIPTIENGRKQLHDQGEICQPKYGLYKTKQECNECTHRSYCQETSRND